MVKYNRFLRDMIYFKINIATVNRPKQCHMSCWFLTVPCLHIGVCVNATYGSTVQFFVTLNVYFHAVNILYQLTMFLIKRTIKRIAAFQMDY